MPYARHLGRVLAAVGVEYHTSQAALELGMILKVPFPTVPTFEPASTPHQRCAAAAHPKIPNPLRSPVPHPIAAEPTMAAPRPPPGRLDLHLKTLNRVPSTPVTRTPDKCNRTDITSDIEASPWIRRFRYSPIPARPQPHSKDFTPPNPRCSYVLQIGCWVLSHCWYRVARWWLWERPRSSWDRTVGCVSSRSAAWVRVIRAWVRWWRRSEPWGVGGGSVRRW